MSNQPEPQGQALSDDATAMLLWLEPLPSDDEGRIEAVRDVLRKWQQRRAAPEPQGWQPGPPPILPIIVWPWRDAPEVYRALSTHGGDEDWVAFVRSGFEQPMWMESGTAFGCCDVHEYQVDGGRVFIGAHA